MVCYSLLLPLFLFDFISIYVPACLFMTLNADYHFRKYVSSVEPARTGKIGSLIDTTGNHCLSIGFSLKFYKCAWTQVLLLTFYEHCFKGEPIYLLLNFISQCENNGMKTILYFLLVCWYFKLNCTDLPCIFICLCVHTLLQVFHCHALILGNIQPFWVALNNFHILLSFLPWPYELGSL